MGKPLGERTPSGLCPSRLCLATAGGSDGDVSVKRVYQQEVGLAGLRRKLHKR